jgi:hypothetical protein
MIARRSLLMGLGSLIAAPAIVRASSLMPIKAPTIVLPAWRSYNQGTPLVVMDDIRKAEFIEKMVRPPLVGYPERFEFTGFAPFYSTRVAWTFAQASKSSRR